MSITAAPGWSVNSLGTGVYQTGTPDPTIKSTTPTASAGVITKTSTAPAPTPTYTAPAPQQAAPTPQPTPTTTPQNSTPAPSSTPAPASNSSVNTYGLSPASGQSWYQLQNGESIANYNARIAAANPNLPAPGTTSSTEVTNNVGTTPTPSAGVITSTNSSATPSPNTVGSTGTASGDNTFTGLINQEANTSATGSPVASAAASGLLASGNSNPLTSGAAYQTYEDAVNKLADFKTRVASQFSNLEASGEPLGLVTGREAALQAGYASQLDALQQEVTQAQQALGYGIQEQGQQQSGLSSAGNIGNTAQGTAQSGLGTAISASAPSGSFPFVFNPQTGQFTNASTGASMATGFTGNYSSDTSKIAQAIMQGKTGYNDGESALSSYYGNTADGNLTQAIIAAGGNPTVLKAQAAAQSSNVTTVGTTPTNTAAAGYSSSQAQYIQAATANSTAQMQSQNLLGILQKTGINSTNEQSWNTAINGLSTELGSANQSTFITTLKEAQAAYISLLGAVGAATPTVNGEQATDVLTPSSTPKQIAAAIDALNQAAYAKLQPLYAQYQTYQNGLGTSGSSPASSGASTATTSVGSFVLVNGQWVPSK